MSEVTRQKPYKFLFPETKPRTDDSGKRRKNLTFIQPVGRLPGGTRWDYLAECNLCGTRLIVSCKTTRADCGCDQGNSKDAFPTRSPEQDRARRDVFDRSIECFVDQVECSKYADMLDEICRTDKIIPTCYREGCYK